MTRNWWTVSTCALLLAASLVRPAQAATLTVPAGGDLQAALNAARPGDTILLAPGATFIGNFVLPVHGGSVDVTLRSGAQDALLPAAGIRMSPAYADHLPKLRSPNSMPALRTARGAAFWRLQFLELQANANGAGDILSLGDGSQGQNLAAHVPHHLTIDRVYVHGDPVLGQKRGIALNSAHTVIINSYVSDIKAVGQDSQAICGWNGPGPFHIENNYLEAAGNVFMLGGDDPKIAGLVPSDIIFRGNMLTRPLAWRDPIVPAPALVTASPGDGGSLAAGTYAYQVVARRPAGTTTATSAGSTAVAATVGAGGSVTLQWVEVPEAVEYRVYGRGKYWTVNGTSFVDTGVAGSSGSIPSGTVWQVKNLFELKNARRARVDFNVMEHNWKQAQTGVAVLFTVRNQYGGCTWCVVEDVVFEYNVVRHVAGGVSILGIDNNYPSQQTRNITIRHNEFSDLEKIWGGNAYFLYLTQQPRDVVIDHNTIISQSGSGVVTVGGPPVYGFVFTNNVARHNVYGIIGTSRGIGLPSISTYFPDGLITRNVFAGGKASNYPMGNEFPTVTGFEQHFAGYASGDYRLVPGTDWERSGTDGLDLGADMPALRAVRPRFVAEPLEIVTTALPQAGEQMPFAAVLEAAGGTAPYRWEVFEGQLPAGIGLDAPSGVLSGIAMATGSFTFSVQVTDSRGQSAARTYRIDVEPAIQPVQILTGSVADATMSLPYSQAFQAAGGLGSYRWSLVDGSLPRGLYLSADGIMAGAAASEGSWSFSLMAADAADASRYAVRSFTLLVLPPPNYPPAAAVTVPVTGAVMPVGATVAMTASAADHDGAVVRVDFYVNDAKVGSVSAAPFTMPWLVNTPGTYRVVAVAVDDDGASTATAPATITTKSEVVLYASDVTQVAGSFQLVDDPTAAGGRRLWNPDAGAPKIAAASAAPGSFAQFDFHAEAGRPYRIWMRGKADRNHWANDSVYLQFSGSVDALGSAVYRIGTTGAAWYGLEEANNVGVAGWGWQDNGFGVGVLGAPIYFEKTGKQVLRIQQREDGLSIDQIVISPEEFLSVSPGTTKNDTTIVAR